MIYLLLILTPLIGAAMLAFMSAENKKLIRRFSAAAAAIELILAAYFMYMFFSGSLKPLDFIWLHAMKSHFYLSVSGLGASLIILTAVLGFLCVIYSFSAEIHNEKLYFALILILISSLMGVFTSRDFLLFYIFWEAVLIPMYFLIGIFGSENRKYAANKFFIYTFLGSVLMLAGVFLVAMYAQSLRFEDLIDSSRKLDEWQQVLSFFLIFTGFAIKLPVFPFHTWLPDAHVQAPTAASVLLAGVLLKMGGYGLFELLGPLYPQLIERYAMLILVFASASVIYGALAAFAQTDIKKLVAYSSVAHMGFVTAAFAAYRIKEASSAAGFVMWAHGLITGMLFFLVGMAYERFHSREMENVRHLATMYPQLGWAFVFAAMASLGLPGLAGFIGEFLTGVVLFQRFQYLFLIVIVGVFLNATYLLKLLRRSVLTPADDAEVVEFVSNLRAPEVITIYSVGLLIVISGVLPDLIIRILEMK